LASPLFLCKSHVIAPKEPTQASAEIERLLRGIANVREYLEANRISDAQFDCEALLGVARMRRRATEISPATACDAHASTSHPSSLSANPHSFSCSAALACSSDAICRNRPAIPRSTTARIAWAVMLREKEYQPTAVAA
jgi:hypothetical protein